MNFLHHFLDETNGSGYVDEGVSITENGSYLCIQCSEHPVHIYQLVESDEHVHPAVQQIEHNGRQYKLTWIEDSET